MISFGVHSLGLPSNIGR